MNILIVVDSKAEKISNSFLLLNKKGKLNHSHVDAHDSLEQLLVLHRKKLFQKYRAMKKRATKVNNPI